jgi:predicted alpha/beta-fold hydrolase
MSQELPFEPFPFITDPHRQTIIGSFFNILMEPSSERKIIRLPDGDRIAFEITTPKEWKPTDLTVVMIHGLCGSHRSPYLVRLSKRLESQGVRAVRINMRGCGSGKGLARQMYHGGRSEDVFEVLKQLKLETPDSPTVLVGFSLGGNIALKMTGELSALAKEFLIGVIAVSPPVDLYSSVVLLGLSDNEIYEKYFVGLMRDDVHYRHKKFKELPRINLPRNLKLYEFDQLYTAPFYGFRDARDYYEKCSAAQYISDIAIPCKILLAEDDPLVSSSSLDYLKLPKHIDIFKTKKGGHMGYLAHPGEGKGLYWLDALMMDWILAVWKL